MYMESDIVYSENPNPILKVIEISPIPNHKIWIRFSTGETKIFDFKPYLNLPTFAPLADETVFFSVYIDDGIPTWNNGEIDIAPEKIYEEGALEENGFNKETIDALVEADLISKDPNAKSYRSVDELLKDLESED